MRHTRFFLFVGLIVTIFLFCTVPALAKPLLPVEALETPKGIQVWLVRDTSLPIIRISFAFRGGAAAETPKTQGTLQLLSNMLDEGAGPYDSAAFQAALRDHAIELGFQSSRDGFSGRLETLVRHNDMAFTLLGHAINDPRFGSEALQRMKAANESRIKGALSDPSWVAARLMNDTLFAGHGYRLNPGGTLENLKTIRASDLAAARAARFARDRLVVAISGDITAEEAIRRVDEVFGALPISSDCPMLTDIPFKAGGKPLFYALDTPQTALLMAWPALPHRDPDYYASVVLNYIFGGGGFSSRLMQDIRKAGGLTYGISSDIQTLVHAQRLYVQASVQPQNVAKTLERVRSIAKGLAEAPVSSDELQAAKDYLTGSQIMAFTSTGSFADAALSLQFDRLPADQLERARAAINAVTAADVQRVAARLFGAAPVIVLAGAMPVDLPVQTLTTLPNSLEVTP